MNNLKKWKILEDPKKGKFKNKLFDVWLKRKRSNPNYLICFFCYNLINPIHYFEKEFYFFVASENGEVFEKPSYRHKKFNNLYLNTYNVELCKYCFHNLDMFNKTGLWCEYEVLEL